MKKFAQRNMRTKLEPAIWNYVRGNKELGIFIQDRHIYLNHPNSFSFDTLQNYGAMYHKINLQYLAWLMRD